MDMKSPTREYQDSYDHQSRLGAEPECPESHRTLLDTVHEKLGFMKPHSQTQIKHKSDHTGLRKSKACRGTRNQTSSHTNIPLQHGSNPHQHLERPHPTSHAATPTRSAHEVVTAPKWQPGHGLRNGLLISGALAVVLAVVLALWYSRVRKRAWRFAPLGRRRAARGPWDERAEEGLVIYDESDGYED
jgi:hypothetical protein